jgi:hypothetical protein
MTNPWSLKLPVCCFALDRKSSRNQQPLAPPHPTRTLSKRAASSATRHRADSEADTSAMLHAPSGSKRGPSTSASAVSASAAARRVAQSGRHKQAMMPVPADAPGGVAPGPPPCVGDWPTTK